MRIQKIPPLALALMLVSACQSYKLVQHQQVIDFDGVFTMQTEGDWNRLKTTDIDRWTMDGPFLQAFDVNTHIQDGEKLANLEKAQIYHAGMTMLDLVDLMTAEMDSRGFHNIETLKAEPVKVGGYDGFVTELSYQYDSGLEGVSLFKGFVKDDELNLVHYGGLKSHYYGRAKPQVEAMLASMAITETP